jgi:hypothetical protein
VIQPGLDKLDGYSMELDAVPAYTIAMGKLSVFNFVIGLKLFSHLGIALDPHFKLNPYRSNLYKYDRAKKMLIAAVGFER